MRWFQALMPREDKFFDLFDAHAAPWSPGAEALRDLLDGGDGVPRGLRRDRRAMRTRPTTSPATCCWPCAAPSSPPSTAATSRT